MNKKRFKGFTLVELVVVISIIMVLTSILVPNMMEYVRKSKYANSSDQYVTWNNILSEWNNK